MSFTKFFVAAMVLVSLASFAGTAQAARARGIDVSQWQLDMNFNTAYGQGIRFAFVRSSRGGTTDATGKVIDERYVENMQKIAALNASGKTFYAGMYHYGRPDTITGPINNATIQAHAFDQAQHFYDTAHDYMTAGYLRPVLDLEADTSLLNPTQLTHWANSFMDHLESLSGVEPLIYMNTYFATTKVTTAINTRDLWLARYNTDAPVDPQTSLPQTPFPYPNPYGVFNDPLGSSVPSHDAWSFWQYTSIASGAQYGASSASIDLDLANGDINFVRSFLIPEPTGAAILAGLAMTCLTTRRRRRPIYSPAHGPG